MKPPETAIPVDERPRLDPEAARRVASREWGLDAPAVELASERDQNFRLRGAAGEEWILKIANRREKRGALELQHAVLERLAGVERFAFPRPLVAASGATIVEIEEGGRRHLARLLTFLPGERLAVARPQSPELLTEVGELLGALARAVDGFSHPAAERPLQWDLRRAPQEIASRLGRIGGAERRSLVERVLAGIEAELAPRLAELRVGVLHNDANDHNVLIGPPERDADGWPRRRVRGLIDFGDAMAGWLAAEPAIGMAYAMLDKPDPLAAAGRIAEGFHALFPLGEAEVEALFPLACLRLALSVTLAADQRAREPKNAYLSISESAAWRTLERLATIAPGLARASLRTACGLPASASAAAVSGWIERHAGELAPVVAAPLGGSSVLRLDLSVGSESLGGGPPGGFDVGEQERRFAAALAAAGAGVAVGGWNEARAWYGGELFAAEGNEGTERRTVHLGIDLFLPAGSTVRAPLAGRVHSLADNAGRLDYGPTILVEHEVEDGGRALRFWTLYGHLSRRSLTGRAPGDAVAAGERLGELGGPEENGGWPPHLHFQLVLDPLGREGEFPGVARPSERGTWTGLSPDPSRLLGLAPEAAGEREPSSEAIRKVRSRHLGPSLSLAYRRPLEIVRGHRQWLWDRQGQPFLDAVNNVAHVGHAHPRVVAAAARQDAVLNTNTRYLHRNLARYAERLAAKLPPPLEVCYFVCSGSEANELALRLARAHTGRRDLVVLEGGYHGNTSTLVAASHYKHAGPGGTGAPSWVHVAAMPDPYRGRHRGRDEACGARYAESVGAALAAAERAGGAAALLCEPLLGCGGQIVPPPGYLRRVFELARAAGALAIADEVQIGFGRVGSHFWAFEAQDAIPDIVTLGKPIGNGYPLGAVVTTRAIAESFANGMEYFNTFGGNPVACAVGLAVLDVIEEEALQARAESVGSELLARLDELAGRHPVIGDARGVGLYLGVELVTDRERREPAGEVAAYVANRMRERGILLSTDGPDHNVLKIKPPLVFERTDAERLAAVLDEVLSEDFPRRAVG